jgi:hypothetical protein
MTTQRLQELLSSARSKNAGPYTLTSDLFFPDAQTFHRVVDGRVVTPERVAAAYGLRPDQVRVFNFEPALAIKVSIPRALAGGSPGDSDVAGGQQFVPLLDLPVEV